MSKRNEDFFKKKSGWAEIKDSLLKSYLEPYAVKLLQTRRPLVYIDGFAGRGYFDDGKDGSPLIACKELDLALRITKASDPVVKKIFIEKKYASELGACLAGYAETEIIDGSFEDLETIIKSRLKGNENLFLYVDPFGIKYLKMDLLLQLPRLLSSVEVLINFNSFGFFREACRVRGVEVTDIHFFDELVERDPGMGAQNASKRLNEILGDDGWRNVVERYKNGEIDGYKAEREIADLFRGGLNKAYRYVLSFPIRLKEGQRPKYRMVHACNHPDGAMLMYETMDGRKQELFDLQQRGQQSLFDQSVENEWIDMDEVSSAFKQYLMAIKQPTRLNTVIATFVTQSGITVSLKSLRDLLKQYANTGIIEIRRDPFLTQTGRASAFMTEGKNRRIYIRSLW